MTDEPRWVTQTVEWIRNGFVGRPRPATVTYRVGRGVVWVWVRFSETVICQRCSRPHGARAPRGRRVQVTLDARDHSLLVYRLSPDRRISPRPKTAVATVGTLRLVYPGRFDRRFFTSCKYAVTGVRGACVRGVVVASFVLPRELPNAFRVSDGVAFRLYRAPRQKPSVLAPTVRFPLSLADLPPSAAMRTPLSPNQERALFFRVKGANYWAIAWIGKYAFKRDRPALASIVSSLRVK